MAFHQAIVIISLMLHPPLFQTPQPPVMRAPPPVAPAPMIPPNYEILKRHSIALKQAP